MEPAIQWRSDTPRELAAHPASPLQRSWTKGITSTSIVPASNTAFPTIFISPPCGFLSRVVDTLDYKFLQKIRGMSMLVKNRGVDIFINIVYSVDFLLMGLDLVRIFW